MARTPTPVRIAGFCMEFSDDRPVLRRTAMHLAFLLPARRQLLRGAVRAGRALGIEALAIVDRNSLAGIVRAHEAAKTTGVRLIVGCRLDLADGLFGPGLSDRPAGLRASLPSAVAWQEARRQGEMPSYWATLSLMATD